MIGAVIFAQNTSHINYVQMAAFAAQRVHKYLDIPVTLVTDRAVTDSEFDNVILINAETNGQTKKFYDGTLKHKIAEWNNLSRSSVYDLSPYDTTLVIDSDYILNSSILKPALTRDCDLQLYKNSMDLASWRDTYGFTRINQYSIPFYWATTFVFNKNAAMQSFFDIVTYIKQNWGYYSMLYNINSHIFRNDFAFSIAIHLMNNKMPGDFTTELPGKMVYIRDTDILVDAKDDSMQFLLEKQNHQGEYTMAKTTGLDMHVMNKQSLLRYIGGLNV